MGQTLIIECIWCGGLFLAADGQKTRTCPYCGRRINVRNAKTVASARSGFQASELLRKIKRRRGFNH